MTKILNILLLAAFVTTIILSSYWLGQQAYTWLPPQASTDAKLVDDLFSLVMTWGALIFFGIVGILVYSIATRRAAPGDFSDAHPISGNLKLEILWTLTPIFLVLFLAIYSYNIYQQMQIGGPTQVVDNSSLGIPSAEAARVNINSESAETIDVIAQQWAWIFRYPQNVTSTELHLPVNRHISLALQSKDVIHGFYVPEFRLKQDIIPQRTITIDVTPNRVGKYHLHDSQFSGTFFALMSAAVYVDSPEDYSQWLAQAEKQKPSRARNRANDEYKQLQEKTLNSNWSTVPPAAAPIVNYNSL